MIAILLVLILVVFMESMIIIRLFREYKKQALKAELLTQMIEGRFWENG